MSHPFTDADLDGLRKQIEVFRNNGDESGLGYSVAEIEPFFARLEAAENICNQVKMGRKIDWPIFNVAYEAWHKAAGK